MRALKQFLKRSGLVRKLLAKRRSAEPLAVALRAIDQLKFPANESFFKAAEAAQRVEGMLSLFSMAVMDMFLTFQEQVGATGDLLEIGTYRGKSAVILSHRLRRDERLTLVDIADNLDRAAIEPVKAVTDFILTPSDELRSALPNYTARRGTFRFVHIDAGHDFTETYTELGMAEELLAANGIIAMDDFANLHYSQNIAAIFKYLFTSGTQLTPVVVTDEKAYLCRRDDFDKFATLALENALAELKSRGIDAVLARTGYEPEYKAIYLRPRSADDESSFYGEAIFQKQIMGVDGATRVP